MKKSTKISIIIFIVTFLVGYVMALFIPDEALTYVTINGSILSFLGDEVAKFVGMRTIIATAVATVVVLLIRIVDSDEEEKTTKKLTSKKPTNKQKKDSK